MEIANFYLQTTFLFLFEVKRFPVNNKVLTGSFRSGLELSAIGSEVFHLKNSVLLLRDWFDWKSHPVYRTVLRGKKRPPLLMHSLTIVQTGRCCCSELLWVKRRIWCNYSWFKLLMWGWEDLAHLNTENFILFVNLIVTVLDKSRLFTSFKDGSPF